MNGQWYVENKIFEGRKNTAEERNGNQLGHGRNLSKVRNASDDINCGEWLVENVIFGVEKTTTEARNGNKSVRPTAHFLPNGLLTSANEHSSHGIDVCSSKGETKL